MAIAPPARAFPTFRDDFAAFLGRECMPRLKRRGGDSIVIRLSCPVLHRRLSLARYRLRPHSFACGKLSRKLSRRLSHPVGMGEHEGMRSRAYAPLSLRAFSRGFLCFRAREKSPRVFPKGKGRDFSRPLCCLFLLLFTSSESNTSRP